MDILSLEISSSFFVFDALKIRVERTLLEDQMKFRVVHPEFIIGVSHFLSQFIGLLSGDSFEERGV